MAETAMSNVTGIREILEQMKRPPEYKTARERAQLIDREAADVRNKTENEDIRLYLQDPYLARRKKVLLDTFDRAEKDFGDFGLTSFAEAFTGLELRSSQDYNFIDRDNDIKLGAVLWILDTMQKTDKSWEMLRLVRYREDGWIPDVTISHPCYSNDLIESMVTIFLTRYTGSCEDSVMMEQNARGKAPREEYRQILSLLPEDAVKKACAAYKEKVWEIIRRYLRCLSVYDRQLDAVYEGIVNIVRRNPGVDNPTDTLPPEMSREGAEVVRRYYGLRGRFQDYLTMSFRDVKKETGSGVVAKAATGFRVENPYELCFALYYLIDSGDDMPWLVGAGSILMTYVKESLPWFPPDTRSWDEDKWLEWEDGPTFDSTGWMEREAPEERADCYNIRYNGKNAAQIIFELSHGILPVGIHPFEEERKKLIGEGMDESVANMIADKAELLFLPQFEEVPAGGYEDEPEQTSPVQDEAEGSEGKAAAAGKEAQEEAPGEDSPAARELARELEEVKRQNKSLLKALAQTTRQADERLEKAERELRTAQQERRELADLRELLFNRENAEEEERESAEEKTAYPYETRKRTVVFGGHESFLKAFRPKFPTVKFVDAANPAFDPRLITNAEVVWVQPNRMSHAQFYRIASLCKKAGVQIRYFTHAGAEKCAEQLVEEDRKQERKI